MFYPRVFTFKCDSIVLLIFFIVFIVILSINCKKILEKLLSEGVSKCFTLECAPLNVI